MPDALRHQQLQELFESVQSHPATERAAYLDAATDEDAALRAEVLALLAAADTADVFMDRPAVHEAIDVLLQRQGDDDHALPDQLLGKRVGAFTIRNLIGRGGMGAVYEAFQDNPRRVVALKIMRRGLATGSALRRFRFEAKALGRLQHANIAQIYDAGMYDDGVGGVPYFALEYVRGAKTITEYAASHKFGTRERLDLFKRVCEAVHHGHQKGVIHRDLKPANILVDADGHPKIIDFGVARATDSDVTMTTQATDVGELVGTLQYMSPEQCTADPHDLDTRTDVYSLGAVLYELLTGALPYEASSSSLLQATQTIRETTPRRLSSIDRALRGDVETIVLKALEKERDRRYQSAADLANDIHRYLTSQPIAARPASVTYQLSKYLARYRWQVAAITVTPLLAIALGVAVIVWQSRERAAHARDDAVNARHDAEKARDEAVHAIAAETKARTRADVTAYGASLGAAEGAIRGYAVANARGILDNIDDPDPHWEWKHLRGRVDESKQNVLSVPHGLGYIALSESGRIVAYRLADQPIMVRQLFGGGAPVAMEDSHRFSHNLAISPDERLVAAVLDDSSGVPDRGGVAIWNAQSGKELHFELPAFGVGSPNAVAFSGDGCLLACATSFGWVHLWDSSGLANAPLSRSDGAATVRPLAKWRAHSANVVAISFSHMGDKFATGSHDYTAAIWDVKRCLDLTAHNSHPDSIQPSARLRGHSYYIEGIAFNPDDTRLATASMDKTVKIWDVPASIDQATSAQLAGREASGVEVTTLLGHTFGVSCVAFDQTGTRLASGGGDTVIRVWAIDEGAPVVDAAAVKVHDSRRFREIGVHRGHEKPIKALVFTRDGTDLLSGSTEDGTIKRWPSHPVEDVPILVGHSTSVAAAAFHPIRHDMLVTAGGNAPIVWDTTSCRGVSRLYGHQWPGDVLSVTFNRDGDVLATASHDHTIRLWDASTEPPFAELTVLDKDRRGHDAKVYSVAFSPSGAILASAGEDRAIRIWDVRHCLNVPSIGEPEVILCKDPVYAVVFLSESVIAAANGNVIQIRNIEDNMILGELTAHDGRVRALAVNRDRTLLASSSDDESARLWDIEADGAVIRERHALRGHTGFVESVAFHPTEPRLATGSLDKTIKLWDIDSGVQVAVLSGSGGRILCLAFSPDGQTLASTSAGYHGTDNVVRLWEVPHEAARVEQVRQERAATAWARMLVRDEFLRLRFPHEVHASLAARLPCLPEQVLAAVQPIARFHALDVANLALFNRLARKLLINGSLADHCRAAAWIEQVGEIGPKDETIKTLAALLWYRSGDEQRVLDAFCNRVPKQLRADLPFDPEQRAVHTDLLWQAMRACVYAHREQASEARQALADMQIIKEKLYEGPDDDERALIAEAERAVAKVLE